MADAPTSFYLTWTLPNFITVILMVALGSVILGLVASSIGHFSGGGAE